MFDFQFTPEEMEEIRNKLTQDSSYSDFIDLAFSKLWSMTDNSLAAIKERIENELKPEFNLLFDQLQRGIDKIGGEVNFLEIKNSITRARTVIQHDLDRINTWFNRSNKFDIADYNVKFAVDIAIAIVEYTHPNKTINIEFNTNVVEKLNGKSLKGFVDIFYNLLENSVTYSLLDEPNVLINFELSNGLLLISSENWLSENVDINESKSKLEGIQRNIDNDFALDKVSDEGGTGLYKIMKILNIDFGSPSSMEYCFTDRNSFILKLSIEKGESLFV